MKQFRGVRFEREWRIWKRCTEEHGYEDQGRRSSAPCRAVSASMPGLGECAESGALCHPQLAASLRVFVTIIVWRDGKMEARAQPSPIDGIGLAPQDVTCRISFSVP